MYHLLADAHEASESLQDALVDWPSAVGVIAGLLVTLGFVKRSSVINLFKKLNPVRDASQNLVDTLLKELKNEFLEQNSRDWSRHNACHQRIESQLRDINKKLDRMQEDHAEIKAEVGYIHGRVDA